MSVRLYEGRGVLIVSLGCAVLTVAGDLLSPRNLLQRDRGERDDHQQLEIIDVGKDLRLLRDHGVERGTAGIRHRIPELCDGPKMVAIPTIKDEDAIPQPLAMARIRIVRNATSARRPPSVCRAT